MNVRDLDPCLIFYGKFPIVTDVKIPAQLSSYRFVVFLSFFFISPGIISLILEYSFLHLNKNILFRSRQASDNIRACCTTWDSNTNLDCRTPLLQVTARASLRLYQYFQQSRSHFKFTLVSAD